MATSLHAYICEIYLCLVAVSGIIRLSGQHSTTWSDNHVKHIATVPQRNNSVIPKKFFDAPRNCNPHNYTYIINNENVCSGEVFMLFVIRTIPRQFDRRMAIRDGWGSNKHLENYNLPVIFVFGKTKNKTVQAALEEENKIYRDIVQEDFPESYHTLNLKSVMAWKWAYLFCPQASYVMVANDEVVVDIFKLASYIQSYNDSEIKNTFLLCCVFRCCYNNVVRVHGRYGISEKVYENKQFPTYCSGTGYVAPSPAIHNLYHMSIDTPTFMPDDAWIGVLAEKLGMGFVDTISAYSGLGGTQIMHDLESPTYLLSPKVFSVFDYEYPGNESMKMREAWKIILRKHETHMVSRSQVTSAVHTCWDDRYSIVSEVSIFVFLINLLITCIFLYYAWLRKRIYPKFT